MIHWLVIWALLTLAALVQGSVGFGFGLVAISALVVLGMNPPQAVLIGGMGSLVMSAAAAWRLRREVHWRSLLPLLPVGVLGTPLGVLTLAWLHDRDPRWIKQAIGVVVLLAVTTQWALRIRPRERVAPGWGVLALMSGGFLNGFVGMGGPPVVLWALSHQWTSARIRGTLLTIFACWTPVTMTLVSLRFPDLAPPAFRAVLLACPVMIVGAIAGLWLGHHTPVPVLRRLAMSLLIVIAIAAIAGPWL